MAFEVELKFRVVDPRVILDRLAGIGAEGGVTIRQEDHYLAHPARDFARTNEALRVRRDGPVNRVTYKGPKAAGPTKTREEIEVAIAAGDGPFEGMVAIFRALGFRPVAVVAKDRTPFHVERSGRAVEVVIDRVDGHGTFVEVEAIADGPADLAEAQAAVLSLARELDLTEPEPRSYLRMVLGRDAAANPAGET